MIFPPAPPFSWVYRAKSLTNYDGDTVTLTVDLGFKVAFTINLRLLGINCPELNATDPAVRTQALAAKTFTADWLAQAASLADPRMAGGSWPLLVDSFKAATPLSPDKFGGRWDGLIYSIAGNCLNQALLDAGLAVPMP